MQRKGKFSQFHHTHFSFAFKIDLTSLQRFTILHVLLSFIALTHFITTKALRNLDDMLPWAPLGQYPDPGVGDLVQAGGPILGKRGIGPPPRTGGGGPASGTRWGGPVSGTGGGGPASGTRGALRQKQGLNAALYRQGEGRSKLDKAVEGGCSVSGAADDVSKEGVYKGDKRRTQSFERWIRTATY